MSELGKNAIPFFFLISFDKTQGEVYPLSELPADIWFDMDGFISRQKFDAEPPLKVELKMVKPITYRDYKLAFERVISEMQAGNTYLLNLTFPSQIDLCADFESIYGGIKAIFKVKYRNKFLCFSPERFVRIADDTIQTYPMKGTRRVVEDPSGSGLLGDSKESAEHLMIVDLLRNDLSRVADQVRVCRFRYLEQVGEGENALWQTSSQICGRMRSDWPSYVGDMLMELLPAGSVSGTPKHRTLSIIHELESDRGFYSGVAGIFDGKTLDSAVLIRYVEKKGQAFYFHSGGGITVQSDPLKEYQELLSKIYLPIC